MFQKLKSWPDFHHRINMVYHGVIALSLIPFVLVFLDIDSGTIKDPRIPPNLIGFFHLGMLPLISIPWIFVWRNAKSRMKELNRKKEVKQRLVAYFVFQTRRYLLLEIGAILSLVAMWLTLSYIYIMGYLLILVQFSLLRPSQDKVIRDLAFDKEEREKLRAESL